MYVKTKDKVKKSSSHDGKEPLTRLAALATLSPRERAVDDVCLRNARTVGTNLVKSLKTKADGHYKVRKRTQNELETNSFLSKKMRESRWNSAVSWQGGTKPRPSADGHPLPTGEGS
jgi:hypothetical protein